MNLEHLSEAQYDNLAEIKIQIQKMTVVANESYEMIRSMLAILQTENLNDPLCLFTRYADQISERSSVKCYITNQGQSKQLTLYQIRQLFYIFREALSNVEKYANASRLSGEFIWGESSLKLVISDDGIGFDPQAIQKSGHYGLNFMRERAELLKGSFYIRSIPKRGTTITIVVPYESAPTA
jgi:two-component system sensor histidine kinase DegS